MTFTFDELNPTKLEKKKARLTSGEKRLIKSQRHLRCAISNQTFSWGERYKAHLHHKREVQHGGTGDRSNLVILEEQVHKKLHEVARTAADRLLEVSNKFKSMKDIKKAKRLAAAEASIDVTNHAVEMTRLSMVADLGDDVRYVYGDEYAEQPEVRKRIDKTLGNYEG